MHTGLPAAPLRQTPSAIRDDRFTRCPFPAATTDAPVAPVRSSNTAMEHQNCCTDLRHPELLAACCPYSSVHGKLVVQHPSRTKKVGKLPPFAQFQFFDPTGLRQPEAILSWGGQLARPLLLLLFPVYQQYLTSKFRTISQ